MVNFFLRCVGRERGTLLYMVVKEKAGLGCNDKIGLHHKPSAFESEIHPSHKTSFYALCISPLQGGKFTQAEIINAVAFMVVPDTADGS